MVDEALLETEKKINTLIQQFKNKKDVSDDPLDSSTVKKFVNEGT
jgi:hypothetical protein